MAKKVNVRQIEKRIQKIEDMIAKRLYQYEKNTEKHEGYAIEQEIIELEAEKDFLISRIKERI